MSDFAARAVAAHESETRRHEVAQRVEAVFTAAHATQLILELALALEIPEVKVDEIRRDNGVYLLDLPLTDDATLRLQVRRVTFDCDDPWQATAVVWPCDQLDWDLPPGQEKKGSGGGTYGCHGLSRMKETVVTTLAGIGAQITRVEKARAAWRRKHCPKV